MMRLFTIEECERVIPSGEWNRELFLECTRSVTRTGSYLYEPGIIARIGNDPGLFLVLTTCAVGLVVLLWRTRKA